MIVDLDQLKHEFIGKSSGQLTIVDVFRDYDKKCFMFTCKCTCGAVKNISKSNFLSGRVKSCGCYRYTDECHEKMYAWHNDDKKVAAHRSRCKQWSNTHHSKMLEIAEINKQLRKDNPTKFKEIAKSIQQAHRNNRSRCDFSILKSYVSNEDYENLCSGIITTRDIINVKCPLCGQLSPHVLHNVFRIRTSSLRGNIPMCSRCKDLYTTSSYEQELENYISTFYNGACIRNSRNVIPPLELDLYYPEKKIAIEFNGDYWHSDLFKDIDYHYNKFRSCCDVGVLLVSIFESKWVTNKDSIKLYLSDLFSGIENSLSFNKDNTLMNNNYPSCIYYMRVLNHIDDYFTYKDCRVYTCGYSDISYLT